MSERQPHGFFKMPYLRKPEYMLLREMEDYFKTDTTTELFAALLVLGYEVIQMQDAHITNGRQYLVQILDTLRSTPWPQRQYPAVVDVAPAPR